VATASTALVRTFFDAWQAGDWEEMEGVIAEKYLWFFRDLRAVLPDLSVDVPEHSGAIEAVGNEELVAIWRAEGTTVSTEIEENGGRADIPASATVKLWGTSTFTISEEQIREARLTLVSHTSGDAVEEESWMVAAFDPDELEEELGEDGRKKGHPICRCTPFC